MRSISFLSLFFSFLILNQPLSAQEEDDWRVYKPKTVESLTKDTVGIEKSKWSYQPLPGEIEIIADSRIKKLNDLKKESPTKLDGYRVQIYFGNRNKAQEKRGEFIRAYPNTTAYISYLAPNFRLRVGDFRTRLESEKFKSEIARRYPGSYIVKEKIDLPPLAGFDSDLDNDE